MSGENCMTIGNILTMNARNHPDKAGWEDKDRGFNFQDWNERSCRLANGLAALGVGHGDSFGIMSYNRGEWLDIYAGCAKGGQIAVPIMFRQKPHNIDFIVNHARCRAFIVEEPLVELVDSIRSRLCVEDDRYVYIGRGPTPRGYIDFEEWLADSSSSEPETEVASTDPWTYMYTSGTTGRPKAAVRSHRSYLAEYYVDAINMGVRPDDKVMLVMPMCHVNSIFFAFPYTLVTGSIFVYNMKSFEPRDLLRSIQRHRPSFTSMVPTHYRMILDLPEDVKRAYDVASIRQLLISSAPAGRELKLEIMEFFRGVELWEAYGTTEGGMVTLLRPEDQLRKLGSVGRECFGVDRIKLLDEDGNPVKDGEVGELFYRTPMLFDGYLGNLDKTSRAFKGEWSSAGDMARRDEEGYYYLVDRKENMIITGGENVYPSEVEAVLRTHQAVKENAVIGLPDRKWGEAVTAVVVLKEGYRPGDQLAHEIVDHCRQRIAGFMKPRKILFIEEEEMPRNATGKILHYILRERYSVGGFGGASEYKAA